MTGSFIVERKMLGTAYGILVAMENTGYTIGPLLVAAMQQTKYKEGYFAVSILHSVEALIGAVLAFYILYYDLTHTRVLTASSKQAVAIQKQEYAKHKARLDEAKTPVVSGL